MAGEAKERLLAAAHAALVEDGVGGASARTVAARAEVAPGLIYYHFGDLVSLLAAAARAASEERAVVWEDALTPAGTLSEVVATARRLHVEERAAGNLVVLGQLLVGARGNEVLGAALRDNFALLAGVVERTLARVLADSPLDGSLDPARLARAVSAGFLGLELLDDVVPDGDPFTELALLAGLADEVLGAGRLTSAIVRRRLREAGG